MKKIITILLLLPLFAISQIKVNQLPNKTTNYKQGDNLIIDDSAGTPSSTHKISVKNLKLNYGFTGDTNSFYKIESINDTMVLFKNHITSNSDTLIVSATPSSSSGSDTLGWKITGNTTYSDSRFIGTINNHDFLLKTNNTTVGYFLKTGLVGIGVSPTAKLHIQSSGSTSATFGLKVVNGNDISLQVRDDGSVYNLGGGAVEFNTAFGAISLVSNTTGNYNTSIGVEALRVNTIGSYNTATGNLAMSGNTTGSYNVATGWQALGSNVSGLGNVAIGWQSLRFTTINFNVAVGYNSLTSNTTGIENTAVGTSALGAKATGDYNTAVGSSALGLQTSGDQNTAIGAYTLHSITTGVNNTACGQGALYTTTGSNSVGLGFQAGREETGSNKLYIDNQNRGSESTARTNALIYGIFDASVSNQQLTINGIINSGTAKTVVNASTSGTVTYSQPFGGSAYKKIIIYLAATSGTASYTFPVAFTNTPAILTTDQVSGAVVTSLNTTAVTVTGSTTTGFIILEGY